MINITLTEWLILSVVGALSLGGCIGHYFGYHNGVHDGKMTERESWLERNRRKAAAKPYDGPPIKSKTGPARLPLGARQFDAAMSLHQRSATTARDIAPVIIPGIPGRPQAAPEPSGDTTTLPRLTLHDTGEIRAIGAAWEEKTRREQAVWSHEYHERCEADRQEAGLTI